MQFTKRVPWSPRFPRITKQCFLMRKHNDSAFRGQLALVRFAKTLRGWRASTTQQESDLRCVLKQVKPRQELGLLALAVEIKPPPSLFKTVQPPLTPTLSKRSHPTHGQTRPSPPESHPQRLQKHGQTHPSPVKAWSKPLQSNPTFKTRSNPPHPPAPLLNRSNTVKRTPVHSKHGQTQPNPPQTHAEPTPNPLPV